MINISNTGEQLLQFPRNISDMPRGAYRLTLRNTLDQKYYEIPIAEVSETMLLINISVNLPDVSEGEYEYQLYKGGRSIGAGLLIIGKYVAETQKYNHEITYTQYEQ